jgi:hypothetical protein
MGPQGRDHRFQRHLHRQDRLGEGIALAGKQSIRFKGNLRLLVAD